MQKRKEIAEMKRMMVILLLSLLIACVPTPEEEPIVNRSDAYENTDTITADGPQSVLGGETEHEGGLRIDEEYTTPRGVPVTIHANVTAPEPGSIPILRVRPCTFPRERILAWIDALAPDATLCEQPKDPFSREYYAECVRQTQEAIEANTDASQTDYLQGTLEYYIEAYNKAKPESEIDRDKPFDFSKLDQKKSFSIVLRRDGETVGGVQVISESSDDFPRYVFEYVSGQRRSYTGDVDAGDVRTEQMSFSEQSAVEQATALLERLGITEMRHAYTEIMFRHNETVNRIDQTPGAYRLFFTRTVNGMPKPFYWIKAWTFGYSESDKQAYRPVWTPEYIDITVDAEGITSFRWQNPVEIVETVSENVQVVSFDEARKSFDTYIDILRSAGNYIGGNSTIEITDIVFGYDFFAVKDSLTEFDMIPCWFFLGYDSESKTLHTRGAQLILNATDGKLPLSE